MVAVEKSNHLSIIKLQAWLSEHVFLESLTGENWCRADWHGHHVFLWEGDHRTFTMREDHFNCELTKVLVNT